MMASPVMMVPETTTTTVAAVMTMVMSARFPQSSTTSSQAPTGGRLVLMYQADRLALGAIDSFVMTSFMNKISFLISCLSKSRFTRSRWQRIGSFPNSVDPSLNRYLNQFCLLLELKTFEEQIQLSPLNSSSGPKPPPINPLVNPKTSPQLLSKLQMAESSNTDVAIFGLKVKL
jgi:hypothetical protein